jgi:hypothetical protein
MTPNPVAVGIHQPNYLPWLGYFQKIALSDAFVFFDNVQMPGGKSFVSRNRVLTPQGPLWLTVPIARTSAPRRIAEVPIAGDKWLFKHLRTLEHAYTGSPWRDDVLSCLTPVLRAGPENIADLNIALIEAISRLIGLEARFLRATTLDLKEEGADSIPEILALTAATIYVTGAGAGTQRYLDTEALAERGIETRFLPASVPTYPQSREPFEANLSIVDALFNIGPDSCRTLLTVD